MHPANLMTMAIIAGSGVILIALGIPLWLRRVKPNHMYGFRIRATLENEDTWYEVNARCGRQLFLLGIISIAMGIIAAPIDLGKGGASDALYLWILILVLGIAWITVTGYRLAHGMEGENGDDQ